MPRPKKHRRVCCLPHTHTFVPAGRTAEDAVVLTVDEYETIRLIDNEGLSQEQCCELMQVARTTVQRIYDSARKKIASALVEGAPLMIEGGEFHLCDGCNSNCENDGCFKRLYHQKYQNRQGF